MTSRANSGESALHHMGMSHETRRTTQPPWAAAALVGWVSKAFIARSPFDSQKPTSSASA